jgi:putative ABC transport system permease protein
LTSGLSNAITEQFSSFGVNVLAVSPYTGMAQSGPPNSGDTFLTDTDIQKIKSVISNYNYVAGAIFRTGIAEYNKEKQILTSLSYKGEYWKYIEKDLDLEIEEGRFLRPNEKSTIVLGYKVATDTFDKEVSVGESIYIGDKKLRVVGILKERGDLFVDSSTMLNFDALLAGK